MAVIHKKIELAGENETYMSFININNDIVIEDFGYETGGGSIMVIKRTEWESFKEFIDNELSELEK